EDGIRDRNVTGVQTCALPISDEVNSHHRATGNQARGRIPKVTIYFISQEVADQKEISGYDGFNECRHLWTFRWESCPLQWAEGRSEERRVGKEGQRRSERWAE